MSLIAAKDGETVSKNITKDIENTSGELREQNKLFERRVPSNFLFSVPSRVAEGLGFRSFSADIESIKHIDLDHIGKQYYPTREEFGKIKTEQETVSKNLVFRRLEKRSFIQLKGSNRSKVFLAKEFENG